MKVSVVIPTYNSASFLDGTLKSVSRAAEGVEHEIIVVDDCSKDIGNLKELLSNWTNVTLIEKKSKSNAAVSRNIGIDASNGEYVFLLDSDDHFLPEYVKRRIDFMEKNMLDFSFGAYINVWGSQKQAVVEQPTSYDAKDFLFVEDKDIRTSTISFLGKKKSIFHFNENLKKHQDWGFLIDTTNQSERWQYDSFPGVELCCLREGRMSGKMNLQASKYFMNYYLKNDVHISGFSKRHFALAALLNDKDAYTFFSEKIIASRLHPKFRVIKEVGDIFYKLNIFSYFSCLLRAYKFLSRLA